MRHTSYAGCPRLGTLSDKSLGINLIGARSIDLSWRSFRATRRNGRSGREFIISQEIIKLLLESPLNIWNSTLAWVSLAGSAKGKRILPPVEASSDRRSSLAAREFARRDFSRAHLSHSPGSIFHFSTLSSAAIPAIRGRAVCPI